MNSQTFILIYSNMKNKRNEKYIEYANRVFEYFTNQNSKVGQGGFYLRWLSAQEGKMKHQDINMLWIITRNLIENGYLDYKEDGFICLTQLGYNYTQGGYLVSNSIDLTQYVNVKENSERQFNSLWDIIGLEKEAPFYVSGPVFFDVVKTYIKDLPPSYQLFLDTLDDKCRSRVVWFSELYLRLEDNLREPFLKELSEKIRDTYDDNTSNTDSEDELLDLVLSQDENISVNKKEIEMDTQKPVKIFISHSSKDKDYVKAFVDLLISMGINKPEQLFCSSYPSFDVKLNNNIFDTLKQQYNDYRLYMVYMLSDNYYASPVSLNEMGAGWVLQYEGQCITLPGFDVTNIKGCVDKDKIALVTDSSDFKLRLNEFKDQILSLMCLPSIENNLWEQKRDEFVNKANP